MCIRNLNPIQITKVEGIPGSTGSIVSTTIVYYQSHECIKWTIAWNIFEYTPVFQKNRSLSYIPKKLCYSFEFTGKLHTVYFRQRQSKKCLNQRNIVLFLKCIFTLSILQRKVVSSVALQVFSQLLFWFSLYAFDPRFDLILSLVEINISSFQI